MDDDEFMKNMRVSCYNSSLQSLLGNQDTMNRPHITRWFNPVAQEWVWKIKVLEPIHGGQHYGDHALVWTAHTDSLKLVASALKKTGIQHDFWVDE